MTGPADKGGRLDSWKEISAYLGRNVRTCQNWEHALGLPVHRLDGRPKARVFAYVEELASWRDRLGQLPGNFDPEDDGGEAPSPPGRSKTVALRRSSRAWMVVALLAGPAVAAVATALLLGHVRRQPDLPVGRFTIDLMSGCRLAGLRSETSAQRPTRTAVAISRDGSFVVYAAEDARPAGPAKPRLFLRDMDKFEAKPIEGTEGGINPFLSPDDRWVGFWAEGKLKKVPVKGGVSTALRDLSSWFFGASWGRYGIVFTDGEDAGLSMISADGGKPETLTRPDPGRGETSHRLPFWLPDGRAVLFTIMKNLWDARTSVGLFRRDTRQWRILLEDAADARYVPTGHLVFLRQGTLMAVRFDLGRMELIGQPVALIENVMQSFSRNTNSDTRAGQFAVSDAGSLIYCAGGVLPPRVNALVWVDQKGAEQPATELLFPYFNPRLSPDGQKVAYASAEREWRIWVYDLGRGTNTPLTGDGIAHNVIWSPDGKRLCYDWQNPMDSNLYLQPADGSSAKVRLTTSKSNQSPGAWSPDGKTVAFAESHPDTRCDIYLLDIDSGRARPFLNSAAEESYPEFSPDGRWLAYASDESKRPEVYVSAFPRPGMKVQISNQGGIQPLWSRDGQRIYYRWRDQVWTVDLQTDGGIRPGKPRRLFEKPGFDMGDPIRSYDLSLDSQRFLMVKLEPQKPSPAMEMIFVQNWFEEIKRLEPAGKK